MHSGNVVEVFRCRRKFLVAIRRGHSPRMLIANGSDAVCCLAGTSSRCSNCEGTAKLTIVVKEIEHSPIGEGV